MNLTDEESALFFSAYLPILYYAASDKSSIDLNVFMTDISYQKSAQDILYKNLHFIDEYIQASEGKISQEIIFILTEIKNHHIKTDFFVVEHKENCTVFMDIKHGNKLYEAIGITQPISDLIPQTPKLINAVLLKFKDYIICDGLISLKATTYSQNAIKSIHNDYLEELHITGIIKEI